MKIREFLFEQDYEEIRMLWEASGPGIQLSPSDTPEEIQKKLQRDPDLFIVAERDGQIIGTVFGGFDGRRGIVYHLAVLQGERRSGIGRSLMVEIENRLRSKGCRKYYLLVTKDNEEALAFYESFGAEVMDLYVLGKVIQ
ncbi:MAG: GNAT family N-acetyltransferase [Anaerolineales bacterium]|nr:GNAT family N-acetyltransferase [Anaerolineales bacterium]